MRKKHVDRNAYGIIGLGLFGTALALELVHAGKHVIVLDNDEEKLNGIKDEITSAHLVSAITADVLQDSGISDCGTVVIAIGRDIESNILATLTVKEVGVPRVISKAMSDAHGRVLEKIGAEIILPERDSALRLSRSLLTLRTLDFLELENDISITEVPLPPTLAEKTIREVDFRTSYHLNIIAITRDEQTFIEFDSSFMFRSDDELVVIGKNEDVSQFLNKKDQV